MNFNMDAVNQSHILYDSLQSDRCSSLGISVEYKENINPIVGNDVAAELLVTINNDGWYKNTNIVVYKENNRIMTRNIHLPQRTLNEYDLTDHTSFDNAVWEILMLSGYLGG
jgi:hypothetical protein